jgi:hypothetical protein
MKTIPLSFVAAAALLLASFSASAREPARVLEDAREVTPAMLTLPLTPDGTLAIQGCSTCKRLSLRLARTARFYIGRTEVTFQDLQRQLRDRPNSSVLVVSPIGQNIVTRIKASDAPAR